MELEKPTTTTTAGVNASLNSNGNGTPIITTTQQQQQQQQHTDTNTTDFSQEKTEDIMHFMRECGVSFQNIHVLESKLLEKQNDLMSNNIQAFLQQQNELEKLAKSVDGIIHDVTSLYDNVKKLMPSVDAMEQTIAHIKHRNEQLAMMDDNHHKLETALDGLLKDLNLEITTVRTLENPEFDPPSKYSDSLEAAKQLQRRIDLELQPPKLATIKAVQMRKEYFQTLKEKFCSNASDFLQNTFANEVRKPDKSDERLKISPHTPIHNNLRKYKELVQYLRRLDKAKSDEVMQAYQTSYQTMYSKEVKRFFHKLSDRIMSDNKLTRMNTLHPYQLEDFVNRNDDEEKSEGSAMFALFRTVTTPAESKLAATDTINEEDLSKKVSVTKAFRIALKQILPLALSEIEFLRKYFAISSDRQETEKIVDQMSRAIFDGYLLSEFETLIEKANQMDSFNTLHMLIITDSAVHVFRHKSDYLASFLTQLQRQLAMAWGQFVGKECKWITESTTTVKQAGVLPPIGKFPAFCNEMFKIKKMAEQQAVEITGEVRVFDSDIKADDLGMGASNQVVTINLHTSGDAEKKHEGEGEALVFGEYEAITSTIHKMVAMLFSWLEKKAALDPKYRNVCLMENYFYFFKIFEKADGLRALNEHVARAKREYRSHCREYVKWSVRYQCTSLVEFWDKVLSHTSENKKHGQQGDTTVGLSLYMALTDVKKILQATLGDTKIVKKMVDGLFKRMQKHLKHNELLQQSIWRKITEFFMKRFKKVKVELERAYRVNDLIPVKEEEVYDMFEKKNLEAFKTNFDDASSVASSSIGASSVASSAITGITRVTSKNVSSRYLHKGDAMGHSISHSHGGIAHSGTSLNPRDSPSLSSKESGMAPTNMTLR